MKNAVSIIREIGSVVIVTVCILVANAAFAQWSEPGYPAPDGVLPDDNVAAPINVGPDTQFKDGRLDLSHRLRIVSSLPEFHLIEDGSGGGDGEVDVYRQLVRGNGNFVIQNTEDNGATWTNALVLSPESNGGTKFAKIDSQVRAIEYCDINGNNCGLPGGSVSCSLSVQTVSACKYPSGSMDNAVTCPSGTVPAGPAYRAQSCSTNNYTYKRECLSVSCS